MQPSKKDWLWQHGAHQNAERGQDARCSGVCVFRQLTEHIQRDDSSPHFDTMEVVHALGHAIAGDGADLK